LSDLVDNHITQKNSEHKHKTKHHHKHISLEQSIVSNDNSDIESNNSEQENYHHKHHKHHKRHTHHKAIITNEINKTIDNHQITLNNKHLQNQWNQNDRKEKDHEKLVNNEVKMTFISHANSDMNLLTFKNVIDRIDYGKS